MSITKKVRRLCASAFTLMKSNWKSRLDFELKTSIVLQLILFGAS